MARMVRSVKVEITVLVTVRFSGGAEHQVLALIDTGCSIFAVAPRKFFPQGTLETARHPLRLSSVNSGGVTGGKLGTSVTVSLPICDSLGGLLCHCPGAFVYEAGVANDLILGWPFLIAYQLVPCPLESCIIPRESITVDKGLSVSSEFLSDVRAWSGEPEKTKWVDAFAAGRRPMPGPRVKSWGRQQDAFEQCWGTDMMFLCPPQHCYKRTVDKILLDGARGVILVPVKREEAWFWALGELSLDWWDIPPDKKIFESSKGTPVHSSDGWRLVLFHAQEPEPHHQAPRRHRRSMRAWNDSRFNRDIRSVIEADQEDPRCRVFREKLEQEYEDVLMFKPHTEAPYRGPDGVATIIEKPDAQPQKVVPYRCVGLRAAAFKALLDKFQSRGMLQEAVNPQWISRAFVVPKPGGKWRLVIDYRHLNSQIKDFTFPLPYIEDKILEEGKNVIWSIFDLEDGFHRMPLAESSRKYTAFMTPWGVYEWLVLPMGLKTAPAQYQRMVQWCLEQDKRISAKPYIDDVLAGTPGPPPTVKEVPPDPQNPSGKVTEVAFDVLQAHDTDLRRVFDIFRRYKLTVKREKMFLFQTRVKFCGHILQHGIRFSAPDKRAAIERWDHTHIVTPTHLKAFLGLTQWYAMYMKNYAMHAAILSEALTGLESNKKKGDKSGKRHKIKWSEAMKHAFHQIKESLIQEAMLHIPDPAKPFFLDTDASDFAVGAVLSQHDKEGLLRPVAFFSRKLQGKGIQGQRGWSVREKETYALVAALHKFRSWIQSGVTVRASTDHRALVHWFREDLGSISGPVGRRGRWHEFLSQFHLEVEYKKGEDNVGADTMSRWAYPACEHAPDACMHGSEEDLAGVQRDIHDEKRWEDHTLASQISCLVAQEHADRARGILAVVGRELAADDQQDSSFLPFAYLGTDFFLGPGGPGASDSTTIAQLQAGGDVRIQSVCSRLRHQCWSYEALFQLRAMSAPDPSVLADFPAAPESVASISALAQMPIRVHRRKSTRGRQPSDRAGNPAAKYDDVSTPPVAVLFDSWAEAYSQDPQWSSVYKQLQKGEYVRNCALYKGKIRCKGKLVVPKCLVRAVIAAMHAYSHPGQRKLDVLCRRRFLFPFSPKKLIAEVIAQCPVCQSCKAPNRSSADTLEHFPIPSTPFSSLAMDFVELDSVKVDGQNFDSALIVVCRLSGYIIAIPTRKKGLDAAKLARIFLERCVFFMGIPREIFSDNDHLITSEFFRTLCAQSGIEQHQGVIYRPQSNGRAEVAVKSVVNALRRFLEERPSNWVEALPMALWGLNDLPGAVTPYSPHRLVFGRDPPGFGDTPPMEDWQGPEDALQFFERVSQEHTLVRKRLHKLHTAARKKFEAQHPKLSLSVGDAVWVRNLPGESKLERLWQGPCEVLQVVSGTRFKIDTPDGVQVLPATRLKYYVAPQGKREPFHFYRKRHNPRAHVEEEWVLDKVLKVQWFGKGRKRHRKWQVLWKGHDKPTWEPASSFFHHVAQPWRDFNAAKGLDLRISEIVQ